MISILFTNIISLFGQDSSSKELVDMENGYFQCLKLHLIHLDQIGLKPDSVFIFERNYLPNFPTEYNNTIIKAVDAKYVYKGTKKRKHVSIYNINPLEFEEGIPVIYVVEFDVHRKGRSYTWENVYRSKIMVEFDCEEKQFNYSVVRH